MYFAMYEALLKNVCAEVDPNYQLNGKGSYIQQYQHFIRQHMAVRISNQMKCFSRQEIWACPETHLCIQLNHQSVPAKSVEYINTHLRAIFRLKSWPKQHPRWKTSSSNVE